MERTADTMLDSGSLDTLKRNSVIATSSNATYTQESFVRIAIVVAMVLFAIQFFGQEESPEDSDTTEVAESTSNESTEDTEEVETPETSESNVEDASINASEQTDTDTRSAVDISSEEDTNTEDTTSTDETAEESDSDDDVFVPTEKLSEDVPIPFPVDI
ncbi:MAG: hypothetical protein F4Z01_10090 [Gammaproteobacteria bacterium]|nr:hypothetical protein [Gammaproteobacteria bacterium]MYF38380.1 hypothetical protein [Gammaproteobacteria bacterium]